MTTNVFISPSTKTTACALDLQTVSNSKRTRAPIAILERAPAKVRNYMQVQTATIFVMTTDITCIHPKIGLSLSEKESFCGDCRYSTCYNYQNPFWYARNLDISISTVD